MKKLLLLIGLLFITILGIFSYRMYFKPHEDVRGLEPDYKITSVELFEAYDANEAKADSKYLGKLMEVSGVINEIEETPASFKIYLDTGDLMSSIQCDFGNSSPVESIEEGKEVKVRGFCSGKLVDIVLNKCAIIE